MVQKLCKRGLPLLLCVVLLASLLCVGAAAADTESNVAMNVTTTGDTVSVTVSVKEGTTISSTGLGIFFDTDLLECTSIAGGVEGYPDEFGLSKTSGFNTWVAATAYSSVEDAAREGTVGFSVAGTEDVEYAESVAFTATFTAIADGTAAFTLFEDSKGADGCNSDAIDTVSVTISDGNITINVSSVTLDKTEAALTVGETLTLTATVDPETASDPTVTWASDNESVATVTDGVVTAVAAGTATITATAGDCSATCIVTVTATPVDVTGVTLDKTEAALTVGETLTLTATVEPEDATDPTVMWTSSDESVAAVTDGVVTAVAAGTATITATAGDYAATCAVTVTAAPVDVTGVTLDQTEAALTVGETLTLTATVEPEDATDPTVTWASDNESVATVTGGVVTAVAAGTATITATAGDYAATCTVTVQPAAQPMTVTSTTTAMIGATKDLSTLVSGAEGDVTFEIAEAVEGFMLDGTTLTVAETVAAGTSVQITVTASGNANYESGSATITVTAIDKNDVSSAISFADGNVTYTGAEQRYEEATISGYTGGAFTYSYALDGETLSGLPVDAGEYIVTATYEDETNAGSATATFTITPKAIAAGDFTVDTAAEDYTGAAVTKDIASELAEGTDYTVVYENNVTLGTATITITGIGNYTGELTYSFTIVGVSVTSVTLDQTEAALTVGDTLTLAATVLPENATDPTVTWKSGKASVATVDENGVVTALKAGTAVITATAGDCSAKCTVTVTAKEVASTGAALNVESATVAVGGAVPLTVSLAPADTTESVAATTFESSDESVATVDENGVVTGVAAGTATITATVTTDADAEYTLSCTVTVSEELAAADSASVETVESDTIEVALEYQNVEDAIENYLNYTYPTMTYPTTDEDGNETTVEVDGTWTVESADADGTYTVVFTPSDNESYAAVYATVQAAIARLTPTVEVDYETISTSGKTLEDANLTLVSATCDEEDVEGTLEWDLDETTTVARGTYYAWTFTPDDTDTYETVTGTIRLWKSSSSGGGSSGGSSSGSSSSGTSGSTTDPTTTDTDTGTGDTDTGTDYVSGFTEVTTGEYYSDAVAWAVENGVTTGTSDTTFSPSDNCTRVQVVTLLYRLAGEPEMSGENAFTDVDSDAYYYNAVLWAVANGITAGTGEGVFDPDAVCTRAQIVTFLYRYADSPAAEGESAFADVESGAYYENAVVWAVGNGVTNGTGDSSFSPENACTRAQVVTFLYRAFAE